MEIPESQLPELIKRGKDKAAIDQIYRQVFPVVKKYILRNSGSVSDAEDVFQDAIVSFYESVFTGGFQERYKTYGFIYKVSIFRWINKEKKDSKLVFSEELLELKNEEVTDLVEEIEDEANVLKKLFSNIGDKCVELLNYSLIKDMLIEDIVIRMGFPSSTAVSMQIGRCKEKLIKEMEKNPSLVNKLKGI